MKKKWGKFLSFILAAVMILGTATAVPAAVQPKRLEIRGSLSSMLAGEIEKLDSRITPVNAKVRDRDIIWTSSNPKVLKVLEKRDDDTRIEALKAGKATITVRIDHTDLKASRTITVKNNKTTSTGNYEKTIARYKNSLKEIYRKIKAAPVEKNYIQRFQQAEKFNRQIEKIEDQLDALEDQIEFTYDSGKITVKQYRTLEKKLEDADDYASLVEDYLEDKFGDFDN